MAAKISFRRYGTKLGHRHRVVYMVVWLQREVERERVVGVVRLGLVATLLLQRATAEDCLAPAARLCHHPARQAPGITSRVAINSVEPSVPFPYSLSPVSYTHLTLPTTPYV